MPLFGMPKVQAPALPATGDRVSASDSNSTAFAVMVIMGGAKGSSNDAGLSRSFKCLLAPRAKERNLFVA